MIKLKRAPEEGGGEGEEGWVVVIGQMSSGDWLSSWLSCFLRRCPEMKVFHELNALP